MGGPGGTARAAYAGSPRCCVTGGTEEHDWGEIVPAYPCVSAGARGEDHGDAFGDARSARVQDWGSSTGAGGSQCCHCRFRLGSLRKEVNKFSVFKYVLALFCFGYF